MAVALAQTPAEDSVDEGARLYAENCAVCHGRDGLGRVGATLAKDWPSIRPDVQIQAIIENGVPGSPMPAWSKKNGGPLSDEEIRSLVAYILTWESGGPRQLPPMPTPVARHTIPPIPEVEGDPNNGAVLYDQNCVVCHGPDGIGRIGATLARNWSSIRPDQRVKAVIVSGIEGSAMPAWSQTNGGPLTETEIDDLVAFILTLPSSSAIQPTPIIAPAFVPSWLAGWGGVILTVVLFIFLVWAALAIQARGQN